MSEDLSSILCIVVEIPAGIAAVFLVEKAGRKSLLVSSSAFLAASHCNAGLIYGILMKTIIELNTDRITNVNIS
jgi:hypothetical protein